MAEIGMVLMTVEVPGERPGIVQAAKVLGVRPQVLDRTFGLVAVDPERHLYAVQIRADALPDRKVEGAYQGPFSNPKIAPFGPVR